MERASGGAEGAPRISYPASGNDAYFEVEDRSFWFRHRNLCILEALRRFPPGGHFYEVGGGNGVVSRAVQDAGMPCVLIEPGAAGAANARRRGIHRVICATLEEAGLDPRSMPAIGIFDVLEHMPSASEFLRTLRRHATDGGRLYVTVPAYAWLWSHEDVHAGHFRRYTLASLRREVTSSGFEVEYATYFFAMLPLPIFFARTLPDRIRRGVTPPARPPADDHRAPSGLAGGVLDALLAAELAAIRRGHRIPFGASCLLVARAA